MSRKQEQEPEPTPTITATDTVRLTLPSPKFDTHEYLLGSRPEMHLQVATVDNLRDFIRAVEDRFGSYTDAPVSFWSGGVSATETETL